MRIRISINEKTLWLSYSKAIEEIRKISGEVLRFITNPYNPNVVRIDGKTAVIGWIEYAKPRFQEMLFSTFPQIEHHHHRAW